MEESNNGTYAAVRFSEDTKNDLVTFINDNNIPNSVDINELHTTLLYSRKHLPDYIPTGTYPSKLIGTPIKFEKWPTNPTNGKVTMCLVLRYDCDELHERHEHLMNTHSATYDFKNYNPHITLSYDVGSLQVDDLPIFTGKIEIVEEVGELVNLSWREEKD